MTDLLRYYLVLMSAGLISDYKEFILRFIKHNNDFVSVQSRYTENTCPDI